ncbi:hypothetical protein F5883DRAFT_718989 [Diaporthe sp. PMI_573]|nr:hypothetical protein F5883DRAFT_718989 [Diaporthaceae sp. PMI_573]
MFHGEATILFDGQPWLLPQFPGTKASLNLKDAFFYAVTTDEPHALHGIVDLDDFNVDNEGVGCIFASLPSTAVDVGRTGADSQLDAFPSGLSLFSKRSIKQLGLFFAGAGFFTASILISRRAVVRHHFASQLKYYNPNYRSAKNGEQAERRDPMVAVEALNLATHNVMGFAIMAAGGVSWAVDISTLDKLRAKARRSLYGPAGGIDEDSEREVAQWVAKTLRKNVDGEQEMIEATRDRDLNSFRALSLTRWRQTYKQ